MQDGKKAGKGTPLLSDDSLMREMAHLNAVIGRNARNAGGAWGLPGALAILAGHEVAMEEGFAPRLMSQVEIAQAMGIRPQSVGPLISQLEDAGFVRRVPHEGDRRAHLIEASPTRAAQTPRLCAISSDGSPKTRCRASRKTKRTSWPHSF